MNEREIFAIGGASATDAEHLSEAARTLAEKAGFSLDEAVYAIQQVIQKLREDIEAAVGCLIQMFHEIEEEADVFNIEPRARRRKRDRDRARAIEQRYRTEIRRAESERIYRRIYKPP